MLKGQGCRLITMMHVRPAQTPQGRRGMRRDTKLCGQNHANEVRSRSPRAPKKDEAAGQASWFSSIVNLVNTSTLET